jgi:hypothetical protein
MSAFSLYVFGFLALITGLGYGAYLLNVPPTWIGVGALIMVGLGVMSAVSHTKQRDVPKEAPPVPVGHAPEAESPVEQRSVS